MSHKTHGLMRDSRDVQNVLTLVFALGILGLIFDSIILSVIGLICVYIALIKFEWATVLGDQFVKIVSHIGGFIYATILVLVFYIFITPYVLVIKMFKKKQTHTDTCFETAHINLFDKEYFKKPW
jgi:flagellar biosynthesis protein FlhB